MPPATARLGCAAANSLREPLDPLGAGRRSPARAIAGVNAASAAATGVGRPPLRPAARTFAMASASAVSVPGRVGSHSSALRPVRSMRGAA